MSALESYYRFASEVSGPQRSRFRYHLHQLVKAGYTIVGYTDNATFIFSNSPTAAMCIVECKDSDGKECEFMFYYS